MQEENILQTKIIRNQKFIMLWMALMIITLLIGCVWATNIGKHLEASNKALSDDLTEYVSHDYSVDIVAGYLIFYQDGRLVSVGNTNACPEITKSLTSKKRFYE